jgi:DNA-binding response OmpR family regulator
MASSAAPPLVLVAEDEPTMLELVARHLGGLDDPRVQVITAADGDEAWRLAQEHLPDLVVLDVMMPGMSGWEVCRKIREDAGRFAHTGVLMLTGIGEKVNEMTSPLYGADAYIDKPFDFEELDSKVKETLDARATQREAVPRPATDANGVAGAAAAASEAKKKRKPAAKAKSKAKPKAKAKAAPKAAKKKTPQKKQKAVGSTKGTGKMAAKKGAKKAAKKGAKKAAKKGKKK